MFSRPPQNPVDGNENTPKRRGKQRPRKERRPPAPLDPARLEALALAYTARFATSAGRLEDYLERKLRGAGWAGDGQGEGEEAPVLIAALIARFVKAGYVDDAGYAEAKAGSMLRRGLGARRISGALTQAGIAEDIRADVAPDSSAARRAALVFARKRRFGPFGAEPPDGPRAQKQLAAMLRAGHAMDMARALIRAHSAEEAESWAAEDCAD